MHKDIIDDLYDKAVAGVARQYDAQMKPLGDLALESLAPTEGEHIIDIGCGAGQTCLQLADLVGPSGFVLGVDRSEGQTRVATKRTCSVQQIEIANEDAARLKFAAGTFDALYSRFGVMAFDEPVATFRHLRGALKPGGRLAFVCWRGLDENELDHLPFNAAKEHLPIENQRAAETARPFSFSKTNTIHAVLSDAGFSQIDCKAHDARVCAGDLEETLELCLNAGALGAIVRLNPSLRSKVTVSVRRALADREKSESVVLGAAVWVVTARIT